MKRWEIHTIMKHEFLGGTAASQTLRNIKSIFGSSVTTEQTASNCLAKLRTCSVFTDYLRTTAIWLITSKKHSQKKKEKRK